MTVNVLNNMAVVMHQSFKDSVGLCERYSLQFQEFLQLANNGIECGHSQCLVLDAKNNFTLVKRRPGVLFTNYLK